MRTTSKEALQHCQVGIAVGVNTISAFTSLSVGSFLSFCERPYMCKQDFPTVWEMCLNLIAWLWALKEIPELAWLSRRGKKCGRDASSNSLLQMFQEEIRPPAHPSSQVTPKFWTNKVSELLPPLYFLLMVVCNQETAFLATSVIK